MKQEKIEILINQQGTNLQIIHIEDEKTNTLLSEINGANTTSLDQFSSFIFNQNSLNELTIEGFDFNFSQIQNQRVRT